MKVLFKEKILDLPLAIVKREERAPPVSINLVVLEPVGVQPLKEWLASCLCSPSIH